MSLSAEKLARLAHKYETLGALRRARAAGEPVPHASVFRALAREFPGCLAELDTLSIEVIDERAHALRRAATGGTIEPWMEWLAGYHALLRAALSLKPRVTRGRPIDDGDAESLARDATEASGIPIDPDFVRAVADPPGGRLVALVFARLAELHQCPAATLKAALFPRSRR